MSLECLGARLAPQVNKTAKRRYARKQQKVGTAKRRYALKQQKVGTAKRRYARKQQRVDAALASYCANGVLLWNPNHAKNCNNQDRNAHADSIHTLGKIATNGSLTDSAATHLSNFSISLLMAVSYVSIMMLVVYLSIFGTPEAYASAASAGSGLPYEVWLSALQRSATGPIAFTIALLGIIGCGATLIFAGGEISRFMRSIIYIILVMTLLLGANSLMTNFFNGASINPPANTNSSSAATFSQSSTLATKQAASTSATKQAASTLATAQTASTLASAQAASTSATEQAASTESSRADAKSSNDAVEVDAASANDTVTDDELAAAAATKPAVDPRRANDGAIGSDYNNPALAKQAQDMAQRELKPSVFGKLPQSTSEPSHDFIYADEAFEELRRDILAINPDLTYQEHIDRFISGLINGYGMDSSNQADSNNSQPNNTDKYAHPSVFEPQQSFDCARSYFSKTGSTFSEVNDLNSYQSSPLPLMNDELTLKMSQRSNGDLELQLFEFSSRTLKGFIPSHLDLKDTRLS